MQQQHSLILIAILSFFFPLRQGFTDIKTVTRIQKESGTHTANTPKPNVQEIPDIVIGNPAAPIHLIEYSSLNCVHCALFHTRCWNDFKKKYLDTGYVRLTYRHFALNLDAVYYIAILSACAKPSALFETILKAYETQRLWMGGTLLAFGKVLGFSPEQVDTALQNEKLQQSIIAKRYHAEQRLDIPATPAFEISSHAGYEFVNTALSYQELEAKLDAHLAHIQEKSQGHLDAQAK